MTATTQLYLKQNSRMNPCLSIYNRKDQEYCGSAILSVTHKKDMCFLILKTAIQRTMFSVLCYSTLISSFIFYIFFYNDYHSLKIIYISLVCPKFELLPKYDAYQFNQSSFSIELSIEVRYSIHTQGHLKNQKLSTLSNLQVRGFCQSDLLVNKLRLMKYNHMMQNQIDFSQVSITATTFIRRKLEIQKTLKSFLNFPLCTNKTHIYLFFSIFALFLVYTQNKRNLVSIQQALN